MVLVNAATGAPISAPTANSLSGTMTTQSTNSASLPAGISVQQLLQQAQQQQAAQAQQVQQQVCISYMYITLYYILILHYTANLSIMFCPNPPELFFNLFRLQYQIRVEI